MHFNISCHENVQDGLTLNQQIDLALPAFSISRQQIFEKMWLMKYTATRFMELRDKRMNY